MNRYTYQIYDEDFNLIYESKFDYESYKFAENVAKRHLECFNIGGTALGGYVEVGKLIKQEKTKGI